jgi:hypothetical protein
VQARKCQVKKKGEKFMGKVFLILGILGILLGGAVALISLILPSMTRNVSMDEAAIGIIAGAVILVLSFIPAIVGLIMLLMKKKAVVNKL